MVTATPNKGLPQPTNFGDNNVWGPEVNSGTSILDLNLGGVSAIDCSGSTDITVAATAASNLTQRMTGTLTGNVNYIMPALQGGFWLADNRASGAFSITMKTAQGGSTGVTIPQGNNQIVSSDGTNVYNGFGPRFGAPLSNIGVAGTYRNLTGSSAGSVKTASWIMGELIVETRSHDAAYKGFGLSLSFDGTTLGAGGMDTGSMPITGDISIYAICNPTTATFSTLGCLGSTSRGGVYAGSHMPAGYTASALIYAGVTDASRNFLGFRQAGSTVWPSAANSALPLVTWAGSPVLVNASSVIPAIASHFTPMVQQVTGTLATILLVSDLSSLCISAGYSPALNATVSLAPLVLTTAQQFYFDSSVLVSMTANVYVQNYNFTGGL